VDALSHSSTAGRLGQVIDRWIYTACLCFGLDIADQQTSGFRYNYSIYQIEYSATCCSRPGSGWTGYSTRSLIEPVPG
jgi:hypothetical protein